MATLNIDDESDDLVLLQNAIVVPPGPNGRGKWQPSGVLTADGEMVANSISWSSTTEPVNSPPKMPSEDDIIDLPGTHIFAGISYGHFGHFITESMTRVWALDELRGKADGMVFTPKMQMRDNQRPFEVYRDLVEGMGIDLPIVSAKQPLRVERLYVPKQGFGLGDLMAGSRKYRDYIRKHAGRSIEAEGAEKVYISRSKLPRDRGGLLGEWKLEEYLAAEGYRIFHPQLETKRDQLAQYKKARQIIAVDCSPLHLLGYVGNSGQSVGILTRRSMTMGEQFVTQLEAFHGIQCHIINALVNDWMPNNTGRPSRSSFGEVSYADMYRQLTAAGMIKGEEPWTDLTAEQRNEDLHRIEAMHDMGFKPLQPEDGFASSFAS
ncbi:glycosyltransferase family 61 protein [Paracoccus sp. TK19116]|uniref:Glycosyltransferase family 61 protein n=1 Tax=Paracoccus albicereus TaxID=2922394 RepID=A0ABT1MRD2_9RHOB|nr:glycosyltransferase 61 family protein [Paracoccus albicereus]MCQ0970867.1 glycosyltransferase family 61 protein [Paracoccus albicereus]